MSVTVIVVQSLIILVSVLVGFALAQAKSNGRDDY